MKNYYNSNLTNEQKQYAKETDDFLYELDICKLPLFSTVEIETFNCCNGICPFCPVNKNNDTRVHKKMDIQLFKKIIQELSELEYSGRLGMFSNNEPFLDSRIEDLTKYAREKLPNAVIYLYTNGTVLTKKRYEAIIPYLTYMIIDNYNDYGNMNDKIKIINDLCEKNEYYKSKTKIVMRKQNEVLFSRGGNAPNKKNSTTLDMSCILPFKQIVIRPDGKLSLCNNDELYCFVCIKPFWRNIVSCFFVQ